MPDDHHPIMPPRRNPEDVDHGAIKADLEFLIERFRAEREEPGIKSGSVKSRRFRGTDG